VVKEKVLFVIAKAFGSYQVRMEGSKLKVKPLYKANNLAAN
jgi:hypothetical protein